jgi:ribosomal protein S18 acetylase RimI-like enzyme
MELEMKYSQNNLEQLFRVIGSFPKQEYGQTNHYEFVRTTSSAWPNQLINFKASEKEIDTVLDTIERDSKAGKIPAILMLHSSTTPYAIMEKLRERDYQSSLWYAMTRNLEFVTTQNTNADFKVIQVQDKNDFKEWIAIVEEELMGGKALNRDVFIKLLNNSQCYLCLGLMNDQPVATSFLFVNGKQAGIYLVATRKSWRRQGFGLEMTNQCLLKAKDLACIHVELQATELGKGIYQTLGFTEQGTIEVFRVEKNTRNKTSRE